MEKFMTKYYVIIITAFILSVIFGTIGHDNVIEFTFRFLFTMFCAVGLSKLVDKWFFNKQKMGP